jgi:hypothetical protein
MEVYVLTAATGYRYAGHNISPGKPAPILYKHFYCLLKHSFASERTLMASESISVASESILTTYLNILRPQPAPPTLSCFTNSAPVSCSGGADIYVQNNKIHNSRVM